MNFFSLFKRKLIYNFKNKISIDNDGIDNKTLDFLFHHYGSDKADIFKKKKNIGHGYSKFYEDKLKEFKDKNLNILEIGSFAGASAAAFAKYFSNVNIFCFDVNISNFDYISKKIHVFGVDINNEKKVNKNLEKLTALSFSLTLSDKINTIAKQTEHEMANIFPFMSSPAKLKSEINIKNDPVSTIINPITRFKPIFLPK